MPGGAIVIDNFFIGGYGMGSVDFDRLFDGQTINDIEIAHGGIWLGYTLFPYKLIHIYYQH